ncbi:hypothetical protein [uncultured Litoreibacter sp.]|uniref:hypothetical protein n=1 Tax=uncultured Litoreibacter sp. TaxID=1392394 RepID=UPI0026074CA4|nr:hypothetical protein [uncultured Litoreibacter sp.]
MKLLATLQVAALAYIAAIAPSAACSPMTSDFYTPTPSSLADQDLRIPKPQVSHINLSRGSGPPDGFSCADLGFLSMKIGLPEGSEGSIEQFGVTIEVVEGKDSFHIFHGNPIAPVSGDTIKDGSIWLNWLDGAPEDHQPINLEVELRLVYGNRNGPPERFKLVSP